jgi:hypothetical protein
MRLSWGERWLHGEIDLSVFLASSVCLSSLALCSRHGEKKQGGFEWKDIIWLLSRILYIEKV